jgi:hypothetical protein
VRARPPVAARRPSPAVQARGSSSL